MYTVKIVCHFHGAVLLKASPLLTQKMKGLTKYITTSSLKVREYLLAMDFGGNRDITAQYQKQITKTVTKEKRKGKNLDAVKEEGHSFQSQSTYSSDLKSY